MFVATIRQAAEQAAQQASASNGPLHGYPPWLVLLIGALVAAIALWIFAKLLKWAIWVVILIVVIGGLITAANMYLGR